MLFSVLFHSICHSNRSVYRIHRLVYNMEALLEHARKSPRQISEYTP